MPLALIVIVFAFLFVGATMIAAALVTREHCRVIDGEGSPLETLAGGTEPWHVTLP